MAIIETTEDGNCTVLTNGSVLVQRVSRVARDGATIAETTRLDIITPNDDISAEAGRVQSIVLAARESALAERYGSPGYRAMIRRRAHKLADAGMVPEALVLLKKIRE
jgi:hypothetical protein